MKRFMDEDFLLNTEFSRILFHEYAEKMPIIDYHCHISPREIAEDKRFSGITEIWLGGDHYKWRLMRSAGVEEKYITGDASDKEKFMKWAETLGKAIGNPLYHWSHLELKRYFGYDGLLNADTAETVYELCNEKLRSPEMSAKNIIRRSGVKVICTTDDPADSLEWHKMIKDSGFETRVLPAWRPDRAKNIAKADFTDYIAKLSEVSGVDITDFSSLCNALSKRMDFFADMDCSVSDHGLGYVCFFPADDAEIERIFAKKLAGGKLSSEEILKYETAFMLFMGHKYAEHGWVMQLHYGVKRDNNTPMFDSTGPDTGYDCIDNHTSAAELADFLNALEKDHALPKTILYSLNPADNAYIDTVIGCFQNSEAVGKIQHGAAWWFNDHKQGMRDQLTSLAELGYLAGFVGMLTDSRSFLSYTRHEYFRRVLCGLIGEWVENGEFPADEKTVGKIVSDISYNNAEKYFGF